MQRVLSWSSLHVATVACLHPLLHRRSGLPRRSAHVVSTHADTSERQSFLQFFFFFAARLGSAARTTDRRRSARKAAARQVTIAEQCPVAGFRASASALRAALSLRTPLRPRR